MRSPKPVRPRCHTLRAALIALVLTFGANLAAPPPAAAQTTFTNSDTVSVARAIGPAATYPSQLTMSGISGTFVTMETTLIGLTHESIGDLDVLLVGPTGVAVMLMSDLDGSVQVINLTIRDDGPAMPFFGLTGGTYRPTNFDPFGSGPDLFPSPAPPGPYGSTLSAFNGTNPNGTWSLYVVDDGSPNVGSLGGWSLDITTRLTYTNNVGAVINTLGPATPYPSTLTVSGLQGIVTDLVVQLDNLSHTFPDDIDVLLVGPTGHNVVLMSDVGGNTDILNFDLIFSQVFEFPFLPDQDPILPGIYQPSNVGYESFAAPAPVPYSTAGLDQYYSRDPNGVWSLYVQDDVGGDAGSLGGWSLTFTVRWPSFAGAVGQIPGDVPIPASPYPSTIAVAGLTGPITHVRVTLGGLSHLNLLDLDILLVGPTGANAIIWSDAGGNELGAGLTITLDDLAMLGLPMNFPPTSGNS